MINTFEDLKKAVIETGAFVEISEELYYDALGAVPPIYLKNGLWQMGEIYSGNMYYTFYKKDDKYFGCICNEKFALDYINKIKEEKTMDIEKLTESVIADIKKTGLKKITTKKIRETINKKINESYYTDQVDYVAEPETQYGYSIQIHNSSLDKKTKYISINKGQLLAIKEILDNKDKYNAQNSEIQEGKTIRANDYSKQKQISFQKQAQQKRDIKGGKLIGESKYPEFKAEKEKRIHQLITDCRMFFAFSDKQFEESKTQKEPDEKYVALGAGAYMPKSQVENWKNGLKEINKWYNSAIKGGNNSEEEILYELNNHEAFYTGDIEDTYNALGGRYTMEEIQNVYDKNVDKTQESVVKENKLIKETGEWEDDEEGLNWKETLKNNLILIQQGTDNKLTFDEIKGFDKYQGPYVIATINGTKYKVWTGDSENTLWIDGYPIDNTSDDNTRPGFLGTAGDIIDVINNQINETVDSPSNGVQRVIDELKKTNADPDYVSPNYVADVAYRIGVELTSEEVVYISDNYGNDETENLNTIDQKENLETFLSFNNDDIYWAWINKEIDDNGAIEILCDVDGVSYDPKNDYRKEYGLSETAKSDEIMEDIDQLDIENSKQFSLKDKLVSLGMDINDFSTHASDLYVKKTPISSEFLKTYEFAKQVKMFKSNIDGEIWYEFPFANFDNYYGKRFKNTTSNEIFETYGDKRDFKKIDIYVDGNYVGSTNWSETIKQAKEKFLEKNENVSPKSVVAKYALNESADSFIENGGTEDEYLESPECFVKTYFNGQFGQLKKMLSNFIATGKTKELINYIKELGYPEIIDWVAEN